MHRRPVGGPGPRLQDKNQQRKEGSGRPERQAGPVKKKGALKAKQSSSILSDRQKPMNLGEK